MESLESRMERLTPEQRREVEDFVDFLLLKNNFSQNPPAVPSPSPVLMNAPPVLSADPIPTSRMQDLIIHEEPHLPVVSPNPSPVAIHEISDTDEDGYMDYGKFDQAGITSTEGVKNVKRKIITKEADDKSRHLLEWVD